MRNLLDSFITRRSLLKAGALSAALITLPLWSAKGVAQTASSLGAQAASSKPTGLISFNAGWMIPLEDQKALLELEAKKNQEAQSATQKTAQNSEAPNEVAKPAKKTWAEKIQDSWKQVKSFF